MEDKRKLNSTQPNVPRFSSSSYVYPIKSLLEGRIQPASDDASRRPTTTTSRSSDDLQTFFHQTRAERSAIPQSTSAGSADSLTTSGNAAPSSSQEIEPIERENSSSIGVEQPTPSQDVDKRERRKKKGGKARQRAASVSSLPGTDPQPERDPPLRATKRKNPTNFRHFPAGDNPYFPRSFISANAVSSETIPARVDMETVSSTLSADSVLGHRNLEGVPLPVLMNDAFSVPNPFASSSGSSEIARSSQTEMSVAPKEKGEVGGSRNSANHATLPPAMQNFPPSNQPIRPFDALATPLAMPGHNEIDMDAGYDDDETPIPFDLSQYGLVHLPPRTSSGSNSERGSSPSSSAYRTARSNTDSSTSASRSHQPSQLAAGGSFGGGSLLGGGSVLSDNNSGSAPALSSSSGMIPGSSGSEPGARLRIMSSEDSNSKSGSAQSQNPNPSSGPVSSGETGTSFESEENYITVKFQYRQTEGGHHVVVGREGKLARCDDEPIRTPGSVQGYGVLIAVDEMEETLVVRQVSENSTELLGLPPRYLFGLECFTDTLPDDQAGVLWDNIEFLSNPSSQSEDDEGGPHIFVLKGYGAPGSAIPGDSASEDGKRVWTCWCAAHRAEAYSSDKSVSPGLIVMEFELERDVHNPLYPPTPVVQPSAQVSGIVSPAGSSQGSSGASDKTPTNDSQLREVDSPMSDHRTPGASSSGSSRAGSSTTGSSVATSSTTSLLSNFSSPPDNSSSTSSQGLEGEDWQPNAEEVLASTTSYSKPLPALERLRRMTRGPAPTSPASETPGGPNPRRRSGRRARGSSAVGMMDVFAVMAQINEQLGAAPDLDMFLKIVVGVIKDLSQFHRVLVYQFDETWNGQVVAELVDWSQSHDLFQGLHFPAGDIPAQARELYKLNKVRLLYDRDQPTARMVVKNKDDLEKPLNMTHCYLRAMSPIHIKYLGNMGVRASMSISIMAFDQLWGLVMCHSYGDQGMRVSFPVRQMLRLLSQSISRNVERLSYAQRLRTRKLVNTIPSDHQSISWKLSNASDLLGLFDADFGILVIGEGAKILGPNQHGQEILIMAEYLRMKQFDTIQASQAVGNDFRDLHLTTGLEVISGLLYVPLSTGGKDFIAFLRKGQPHRVHWAGKPYKSGQDQDQLEPRRSFKVWSEIVAGRCKAWTDEQLESAGVLALVYGKFIEVWREKENALHTTKVTNLLLSNASHEVRTPLNHIINYLEMALNGALDSETRDNLSKSHAASKSLLFTINDLLDLTRLESGNETSFNEPFNLHLTIEEATHLYRKEAERRNIAFSLDLEDSPITVVGDHKKICTVVQNLTANALKYTNSGSVTVCCTTFGEPQGLRKYHQTAVEILVADTGCGIPIERLENMFREFEQVETTGPRSNSEAGVGLGLAVVARIVEQLGGQLRVDSTVGQGSKFSFLIPLALPEDGAWPVAGTTSSSSGSSRLSAGSRPRSLFDTRGEKEIDQFVQAISSSHMGALSRRNSTESKTQSMPHSPTVPLRSIEGASETATKHSPTPSDFSYEKNSPLPTPGFEAASLQSYLGASPAAAPNDRKLRILIVEDNDSNRIILAKRLTLHGHTVVNTMNGQEALDKVTGDRAFDLVLMDIQMPIMNGFESTHEIRAVEKNQPLALDPPRLSHELHGRIPIFAVSASLKEQQREDLKDHGLDGWILKPIDFRRLNVILKGMTESVQRDADVYRPGQWELGGWFDKR